MPEAASDSCAPSHSHQLCTTQLGWRSALPPLQKAMKVRPQDLGSGRIGDLIGRVRSVRGLSLIHI
eukprot:9931925-Alexandrium_andersonii.AAC.1